MGLYLCHTGDVNITASRFFVTNVYLHPNVVTMKDNLAQVLKDLRTSRGYSQVHLAQRAKLSLRTIQRIEKGDTQPYGDTLLRLAMALDVTVTELTNVAKVPLQEDRLYLTCIHLSALSFIAFPLFGILIPFILWINKRKSVLGVQETGKRVLNFQITWCCVFCVTYIFSIFSKIQHWGMPAFIPLNMGLFSFLMLAVLFLYVYNVVLIVLNSHLSIKGIGRLYQPALRIIR
jgi:transcriptional regulator with XRE-family HTH domain